MGDFPLNGLGDFTGKAMADLDDGLFYGTATVQSQPLDGQHLTQNSAGMSLSMERHIQQTNERLQCIKQHLSSPQGFQTSARELLEWCGDVRAFQRAFESNLMGCLTVVSQVAANPGYDLDLGYRLLAVCAAHRDKFTSKSANMLGVWCEDLGRLLLLRHQKQRNDTQKTGGYPGGPANKLTQMNQLNPMNQLNQLSSNDASTVMWPQTTQGHGQQQPSLSVVTTVWGVTSSMTNGTANMTHDPSNPGIPTTNTVNSVGHPYLSTSANPKPYAQQGSYPTRPGSRLPQETPSAAQYLQRQNSYPAAGGTPSVPQGSSHYYSQQNSVPPNASPFPQATATATATATAALQDQQQMEYNGFPPGQSQYAPNQANHPQHPPPPYQRSNSFPQYQQPFSQQQQHGMQPGIQKPNTGMSRAQYMQKVVMERQQQMQQQQMQQHYKQQYSGPYGQGGYQMPSGYPPQGSYQQQGAPPPYTPSVSPMSQINQQMGQMMQGNAITQPVGQVNQAMGPQMGQVNPIGPVNQMSQMNPMGQMPQIPPASHMPPVNQMPQGGMYTSHMSQQGARPMARRRKSQLQYQNSPMANALSPPVTPAAAAAPAIPSPYMSISDAASNPSNCYDIKPQVVPNTASPQGYEVIKPPRLNSENDVIRLTFPVRDGIVLAPFRLEHNLAVSNHVFHLRDSVHQTLMMRPDLELQFKCYHHEDKQMYTNWPASVTVSVNANPLMIERQGDNKTSHKPLHLKNVCKPGRNTIQITVTACCCSHLFVLQLVHRPSVSSVLQSLLRKRLLPAEHCISKIKRNFSLCSSAAGGTDDSVEQTAIKVSLKCPITFRRITLPARGHDCKHIQCFDLESYLRLNCERGSWKCPVCSKVALLEGLEVDQFMWGILTTSRCTDVEEVTIDPNSQWKPVPVKQEPKDEECQGPQPAKKARPSPPDSLPLTGVRTPTSQMSSSSGHYSPYQTQPPSNPGMGAPTPPGRTPPESHGSSVGGQLPEQNSSNTGGAQAAATPSADKMTPSPVTSQASTQSGTRGPSTPQTPGNHSSGQKGVTDRTQHSSALPQPPVSGNSESIPPDLEGDNLPDEFNFGVLEGDHAGGTDGVEGALDVLPGTLDPEELFNYLTPSDLPSEDILSMFE